MSEIQISSEDERDLTGSEWAALMDKIEEETEDFVVVITPLGNSVGWRCEFTNGIQMISGTSSATLFGAIMGAVTDFRTVLAEAVEAQQQDADLAD